MEPVSLTYSNPAVEPLPVPPGPPDPPIPPELLAEPARRRLVPRPIARPWQVLVGTVLGYLTVVGLFVALPADSIAEVLLLRYGHGTSAAIRSIDAIPSKNQENVRVEFIYDAAEQRVKDDAEVSGNVLAEIQRVGRVPLRTATIGRWHVAVVRMPWTEFARLRWVPWLMSACYLLVVTGAPFISRRPKLPPEETEYGWFAKNGTPIYARMVRNGYRGFASPAGRSFTSTSCLTAGRSR